MFPHQYLVGSVALVLGALALAASVSNHDQLFRLAKLRLLEDLVGRGGARWACGLLGCSLIVIGTLIFAGWLPRRVLSRRQFPVPAIPEICLSTCTPA